MVSRIGRGELKNKRLAEPVTRQRKIFIVPDLLLRMEEWEEWLRVAEHDIEIAEKNLKINEPSVCAFYCHQAVEKALKALLLQRTNDFPTTHDSRELAKLVKAPERTRQQCVALNPIYIEWRYIVQHHETVIDAQDALQHAQAIIQWIKTRTRSSKN